MNTPLKSKYRLLVLLDKSKASYNALKNAVNLAKLIDGSIDVLKVAAPSSVVHYENQIASMRAMDEERSSQKRKLRYIVDTISKEEGLSVTSHFTFGNVKYEIENHIETTKPDIVVLGKRKKKLVNFLGDRITNNLLKSPDVCVLISGDSDAFTMANNKSIGFLDSVDGMEQITFAKDLRTHSQKPIKLFKTVQNDPTKTREVESSLIQEEDSKGKAIVYEFDTNDNSASSMVNFIAKNDLSMLCIHKKDQKNSLFTGLLNKIMSKTIDKTNIPVLILNN